jgi:hypothetical protein
MVRTVSSFVLEKMSVIAMVACAASVGVAAQSPQAQIGITTETGATRGERASPATDARLERPDAEVVESVGRNIPAILVPQRVESFVTDSVTTSKAGHVLVTKSAELTTTCTPASGVIYFLLVDDVPVRNSAIFSRAGLLGGQVSGVTTEVVPAGTHTIKIGLMCTVPGAYPSGATVTVIGISSVIVLP